MAFDARSKRFFSSPVLLLVACRAYLVRLLVQRGVRRGDILVAVRAGCCSWCHVSMRAMAVQTFFAGVHLHGGGLSLLGQGAMRAVAGLVGVSAQRSIGRPHFRDERGRGVGKAVAERAVGARGMTQLFERLALGVPDLSFDLVASCAALW